MILCDGNGSELLKCSGHKKSSDFFTSWSLFKGNSKVHYCKDCSLKIYEYFLERGTMKSAIYYTCQVLDVAFIEEVYDKLLKKAEKERKEIHGNRNYIQIYMNELLKYKTKIEVWNNFSCSDGKLEEGEERKSASEASSKEVAQFEMDWGKQDCVEDYTFLCTTFERYTQNVEFVNAQQEDLYRDLCRDRLLLRKINDGRLAGGEDIDKVQKRIASTMSTLKVSDFESNKPKTASELSLFERIRLCDENNVKDIYKEPTRYIDHNKYMKYEKDMVLRPLLKTLVGHREFNIDMDDLKAYNLDED